MLLLRACGRRLAAIDVHTLRAVTPVGRTTQAFSGRDWLGVGAPAAHTALGSAPHSRWYATSKASGGGGGGRGTAEAARDADGRLRVYYGSLAPRMKAVKLLSLTTSIVGLAAQPVLMEQGMKLGGTGLAVALCTVGGFFTFVTPLLLHFVTKKYVTELHYDPATNEYTATTVSLLLRKVRTKFQPSDVTVPDVPGLFTSFQIGKKALFVDPALFEDPEHYVRIMGYDKPIDFKLNLTESTTHPPPAPAQPKPPTKPNH